MKTLKAICNEKLQDVERLLNQEGLFSMEFDRENICAKAIMNVYDGDSLQHVEEMVSKIKQEET